MISVDEAFSAIANALAPLGDETVRLEEAASRVLAEPFKALLSQPPFPASAMDGYAVRYDDAARNGAALRVVGISAAGARYQGTVLPGEAVRIYTGAPVPAGADHIVIQEDASRDGDVITIREAQTAPRHIRDAGVDFRESETLLREGARLTGPMLALAAAGGATALRVRRRPRIALIANGDELVLPGEARGPDDIICSIPYALQPMIARWGGDADFLGIARDDAGAITAMIDKARAYDLIVPIGGASVGDRDLMRPAFEAAGYRPIFQKVAVKPGKPTWFGALGDAHVIGLPGNPASAIVTANLFLRLAVEEMLGLENSGLAFRRAPLAADLPENGPREEFMRARLVETANGAAALAPFGKQDSSLQSVMAGADALIRRLPRARSASIGEMADYLPL